MAIDLEQFHQVFYEESFEGLDMMESSLMELDPAEVDGETINAIFRCAHSIKGGSATFGFTSVSEFTHVLETLLDQIRSGERGISSSEINLYLSSVDCMRDMLSRLQSGEDGLTEQSQELKAEFEAILSGNSEATTSADTEEKADAIESEDETKTVSCEESWLVGFTPHKNIFESGNDPFRNIIALNQLGATQACCDFSKLPDFSDFNPEHCYLSWEISLQSSVPKAEIEDVFEWIEDECDLTIEQKAVSASENTDAASSKLWQIEFIPSPDLLRTGNEPSRLFRTLAELGDVIHIEVNQSKLPSLFSIDSEACYLSWVLRLETKNCDESAIRAVFEWVEDDCELDISVIDGGVPAAASSEPATVDEAKEDAKQKTAVAAKAPVSAKKESKKPVKKKNGTETTSIRVGIDKVDSLINMVGELVITQSMLGQLGEDFDIDSMPKLIEGLGQLEQNTRELQESVMKIRMLPISFAFSRFPRMVRDLGQTLKKSVDLEMKGENTELDKTVMEKIGDPLVHLVRNAVDHGIETPEERTKNGKDPSGKIVLNAYHQSGNVVIEIIDDGKGLDRDGIVEKAVERELISEKDTALMTDEQVFDLIFQPGFSTAKTVSDVSGRGVGMDVVKRNIQALNGVVEISSKKGHGSKITIRLPLTLAILDGQLVRVGHNTYIFPLVSIIESLQCKQEFINQVGGGCSVFKLRDDYVPIIELYKSFSIEPDSRALDESLLVVVESEGEKVGIVVDELLAQQQVVIKSLEQNYKRVNGVSGATILGDGTVALILDIPGIIKLSSEQVGVSTNSLGSIINQHELLIAGSDSQIQTAIN